MASLAVEKDHAPCERVMEKGSCLWSVETPGHLALREVMPRDIGNPAPPHRATASVAALLKVNTEDALHRHELHCLGQFPEIRGARVFQRKEVVVVGPGYAFVQGVIINAVRHLNSL